MRLVRRTSCFLVLAATLTVSVAKVAEVRAEQAEIAGIEKVYLRPSPDTDQTPFTSDAPGAAASAPAPEQGVGVLAVAFFSLLVGWVLGAAFSRRRSRSQRHRLRF